MRTFLFALSTALSFCVAPQAMATSIYRPPGVTVCPPNQIPQPQPPACSSAGNALTMTCIPAPNNPPPAPPGCGSVGGGGMHKAYSFTMTAYDSGDLNGSSLANPSTSTSTVCVPPQGPPTIGSYPCYCPTRICMCAGPRPRPGGSPVYYAISLNNARQIVGLPKVMADGESPVQENRDPQIPDNVVMAEDEQVDDDGGFQKRQ